MAGRDSILTAACDPERMAREMAAHPPAYTIPAMPRTLTGVQDWLCEVTDAHTLGWIDADKFKACLKAAHAAADLHRCQSERRKAGAAMKSAGAEERLAYTLLRLEHGGPAVAMYERLQESITAGERRPLPGRVLSSVKTA